MDAEILEVGLCDHRADGVRHAADTQLEARTVRNFLNNQLRYRFIDRARRAAAAHFRHRSIVLDDHIDLGNVDCFLAQAEAARHILVDLDDNDVGSLADRLQVGRLRTEAEPALRVHRRDLNHGNVDAADVLAVPARQLGVAQRGVEAEALHARLALDARHMPRVPGQMIGCVRNIENRRTAHEHAAAEINVLQLAHACGERLVERVRGAGAPAVVHPVAALDDLDRLFGRRQLALIQCCEIHRDNLLIRSVHGVRPRPALLVYSLTIAYIILYLSVSVKHSRAICP